MSHPLQDSFPAIYRSGTRPTATRPTSLAVRTALGTTSRLAEQIKTTQRGVARAVRLEEREALANDLGDMAEAYEDGWDAGSDEDDD